MIRIIYGIILIYFLLGGVGFYFINRKKEPAEARNSYVKFASYFIIIHSLFFSIVLNPVVFRYLALFIILGGVVELFRLFFKSGHQKKRFFLLSISVFVVFSSGFFIFSGLDKGLILFSFLILSIFDSFSQISGQLLGRRKIFPNISPNKTAGGLIGGAAIAIGSALFLRGLYAAPLYEVIILTLGVVIFAFTGDVAASFFKRKYKVKDYSNIIPGHGGFLDRFDSLIAGGAWVAFSVHVLSF